MTPRSQSSLHLTLSLCLFTILLLSLYQVLQAKDTTYILSYPLEFSHCSTVPAISNVRENAPTSFLSPVLILKLHDGFLFLCV